MYVCMFVSMYVRMHVCMYVCMYVSMYVCMYAWMYVCMYVCMYVYIYIYIPWRSKLWQSLPLNACLYFAVNARTLPFPGAQLQGSEQQCDTRKGFNSILI